jgi:chloramphenicol-sensitive protein RarD
MTERPVNAAGGTADGDTLPGFLFALTAYLLWGFLPLYMKALAHVPTPEIIAHRVLWSLPIAGAVLIAVRRTAELRAALGNPRMLAQAALTAALISVNWGIYVWAISTGRALDAALGYYINPLFSVALGALILGERLGPAQRLAIALAAAAVALLTWEAGTLPWVAILLTFSWGFYAFFRKTLPIGPNQGFFLEILLLTPFALGYVLWLEAAGTSHFLAGIAADSWLLFGCGLVTAGPLIFYANGAKRLMLSTIGMLQYIAPTMIFLIAVFVFREPFSGMKLAAFALIWAAVALYIAAMLRAARARARVLTAS